MGILIRLACCREIHRVTTPYVDADASYADLAAVERHLRRCPACQRRVAAERAARDTLKRHCHSTLFGGPPAPAALRERLANLPAERVAPPASRWRQIAVATLIGACTISVTAILTQGSATVLAAQLVADHVKCFFTVDHRPLDPVQVGDRLKRQYGFDVPVPAGNDALGLRLVGARRCISSDGRTVIDLQNRTLTYFIEGQPSSTATGGGPLATNKPRHWQVTDGVLTLTTLDDSGAPLSISRWKKSK